MTAACSAWYQRPGGRQRGDRLIHCHLPAGHPGVHEEADTEVTWTTIDDQPPPVPNQHPAIADLVMADLAERKQLGIQRYGVPLQPHNGRDALIDAYQEAMDLTLYLRQAVEERLAAAPGTAGFAGPRPTITVLCGSTRFKDEINATNARLTLAGELVVSLGVFGHVDMPDHDWTTGGSGDKVRLDELHKRKIDLADRVLVINVGGYVGESTRSEIDYAEAHGKPVDYLEPVEVSR